MIEAPSPDPFLERLKEAVFNPRRSMRRGLDEHWGARERWLLVAAGGLVNLLFFRLLLSVSPGLRPLLAPGGMGTFYLTMALATLMQYGLTAGAIYLAGRLTGGRANLTQCRSVAAWWLFVTALLTPFSFIPFIGLLGFAVTIALLAIYVTEAQGYRSVGATLAVISGLALMMAMLMLSAAAVPA